MTPTAELSSRLAAFAGAKIVCVGDVMLDRFVYGSVERISPEAPIPVLKAERMPAMLGGAGNVAHNLATLGAAPRLVAAIGDDGAGAEIRALLARGVDGAPALATVPGRPTTIKTRFIAGTQQLLRVDEERTDLPAAALQEDIVRRALAELPGAAALVLSDYGKGVLADAAGTIVALERLIAAARAAALPVIVDPKGSDYRRYRGADIVTPNRAELAIATGMPTQGDAAVEAAARRLIAASGVGAVLATRGAEGMTLVPADGAAIHLPAEAREVFDVSGAGDTVVATLAAGLAGGLSPLDAARVANVAAGIVVGKVGTATVDRDELARALAAPHRGEDKVLSRGAAAARAAAWHAAGLRVAFTNGVFDLLHPGHVSLIEQARASADRLVVAVNSDASVRRLKGASRPVQGEASRTRVLAALAAVDAVVVFAEDTPLELIGEVRPDVLVKGADYTLDRVVGAELVQGWGGTVVLARLEDGHSTTATISRMAR
ncbi:MAG: D-glycero-beta-D-manno-heptose-7-phosphate kinase [Alphaproteobacteria bacterium]|nr:D-glycero-beta-D-manno-heptose-7-phosphate kinase [Alphaproteobacteria bacterium]